jgi:SecD/SecF fusion protein
MTKHPYRAMLIWATIIVAFINVYPTVGWLWVLEDDPAWLALSDVERQEIINSDLTDQYPTENSRQARLVRWEQEDNARAKVKQSSFSRLTHNIKRWSQFDNSKVITLGLDLQGGVHLVVGFDVNDLDPDKHAELTEQGMSDNDIIEQVQKTMLLQIRQRVHMFEAKEPVIQALGADQIQIQLPGERDVHRAIELIKKTAQLNFHIVAGKDETVPVLQKINQRFPGEFVAPFVEVPKFQSRYYAQVPVQHYDTVKTLLERAKEANLIPEGKVLAFSKEPKPLEDQYYGIYMLDEVPLQTGDGLVAARAIPDDRNPPYWQILFQFNAVAGQEFGSATEKNVGRPMAIVLDDVVMSAPNINERITMNGVISGSFGTEEAIDLAIALDSGSMVVDPVLEYTGVVSATLGQESIDKGILSALAGIALVGAFMMVYYMGAGIIAVVSLALNAIFVIAAMAYFDMTLTLPGIAGLILTVGMAVDANVLIFERIREELALGHSIVSSIDNGFKRATITILDANVTTLIAAAVLMRFGTGPIEGFAVALSIGVCTSVFSALVVSRALFDFAAAKNLLGKLTMLHVVKSDTNTPFLSLRYIAAIASTVVILIGIGIFTARGSDNFGVDFTQGTNIDLLIAGDAVVPESDVRTALEQADFEAPTVQKATAADGITGNRFLIRVGVQDTSEAETTVKKEDADFAAGLIQDALAPLGPNKAASDIILEQVQTVGPAVGEQLKYDALMCIFFSLLCIVAYIWFRFEWRFALGAVTALTHDVIITVGVLSLLGRQISMPVVAAILTIIGYSLNDTIVVFDRIREDMTVYRGKGHKFVDILNIAINNTLSRTILTSITTLVVVVVLFLFGGSAINDFALALIIGVIVGTYSSIFVASPVVYALHAIQGKHIQPTDTGSGRYIKKRKKGNGEAAQADNA